MNFSETQNYLYALGNEVLAMKLGLENISKLLAALGNPEKKYIKVQIAGTNGKGSTCAFLEAICLAAGINVGMTTSPHLVSVTERVRIGGAEISETDFARHATRVREISENLVETGALETVPTYFEQVTAIALAAFAEAGCELAILETGLGGRFDATTAAQAEIVAITAIDFDHQNILGETLAEIAAEKAAVIRENTRVVVAPQKAEAEKIILEKCRAACVEFLKISTDYQIKKHDPETIEPQLTINFSTENDVYHDIVLGLAGRHQIENALAAVSLAETLREFDFGIEKQHVWTGLENARHRGRLEFYDKFLFDGAHNAAGARALREFLDEFITQPVTMIFGAMRDKDLTEIAATLFPKADILILTKPENPRALDADELLKFVPGQFDEEKVFVAETVREAIEKARAISGENHLILITGSLYLVGEAQEILPRAF